ncbi:uncharacterized protein LOC107433489 isoform X2 [Ziziphus jujuba]|uniref:Uncharacterized protein LOC107433489 isoform X2 n=1 Tax=Ziziphus jujuba TaxID=326968 RepID=A0ABM4ADC5_ZIZJJ|nr:uncharacterized protein LOC107433489 isoform X2 [Ziziphus jujuba]
METYIQKRPSLSSIVVENTKYVFNHPCNSINAIPLSSMSSPTSSCQCFLSLASFLTDNPLSHSLSGKGDKVASGGKGSVTKVPQPLELRIEQGRSFDKGLQYAKRGRHYTHTQSIRRSLETLTKYGVTDGEMCVIANVCPDTVDEAFALILSLKKRLFHKSDPSKVSDTYLNMLCKIF